MPPEQIDVIYISGSGRSGSTLLERILNSSDGVFATGEIHCLWRLEFSAIVCSCGAPFAADAFWQDVLQRAEFTAATIAELQALEAAICRTGFLLRQRLSFARIQADARVQRFIHLHDRLFGAIAAAAGGTVVVDSSKAGPRAWLLASCGRARILHLHRNPRDVIASWRSIKFDPGLNAPMKRMPVSQAALDWLKSELMAAFLVRRGAAVWLDYTALCRAPRATVDRLVGQLGLRAPITPGWTAPDAFQPAGTYHSLNGNPDRFGAGPVQISERKPALSGTRLEQWHLRAVALAARCIGRLAMPWRWRRA